MADNDEVVTDDEKRGLKVRSVHSTGRASAENALLTTKFDNHIFLGDRHYVYAVPITGQGAGGSDIPRPLLEPEAKALVAQYDEFNPLPITMEEHEQTILIEKRFFVLPLNNPYAKGKNIADALTGEVRFDDTPRPWAPSGETIEFTAPVPVIQGEDPHVAFFMAANDLRDYIAKATRALGDEIKLWGYDGMVTVTVVRSPICAIPLERDGMELYVSIEMYAVEESGIMNKEEAVSTRGEVPIHMPSGIEMLQLTMLEEDLIERGVIEDAYKDRPYLEQRIRELNKRRVQKDD